MAKRRSNRSRSCNMDFENSLAPRDRQYDPANYGQPVRLRADSASRSQFQQTYPASSGLAVRTRESHPSKSNPASSEEPHKTRVGPVISSPLQQTAQRIVYSNSGYPPQRSNPVSLKEDYHRGYNTNFVVSSSWGPPAAEAAKEVVCSARSEFNSHYGHNNQQPKLAVSVELASCGVRASHEPYNAFNPEPTIHNRPIAVADTYQTSSSHVAGNYPTRGSSALFSPHQDMSGTVFKGAQVRFSIAPIFHYFYTIQPFWVDDFVVKMLSYYFNFWGNQAPFIF
jgi:hypothetical protein